MWKAVKTWEVLLKEWMESSITDLDLENVKKMSEIYQKKVQKCIKTISPNAILNKLKESIFNFKAVIPVLFHLRN
jgi:hypothetical protein